MESYFHTALYGPKLGQERGGGGDPRGNTWPNTPWNFQMLRLHLPSFGLEYSEPCSGIGKYLYQKGVRGVPSTSVHPL